MRKKQHCDAPGSGASIQYWSMHWDPTALVLIQLPASVPGKGSRE